LALTGVAGSATKPPKSTVCELTADPPSLSKDTVNDRGSELFELADELEDEPEDELDEELACELDWLLPEELEELVGLDELAWPLDDDVSPLLDPDDLKLGEARQATVIPDTSNKSSRIDTVRTLFF